MREFFLNADFDATLRGAPSLWETAASTQIHEMTWHFLFAAQSTDSIVLHLPLPEDFRQYLTEKGLVLPKMVIYPEYTSAAHFSPFGWNDFTAKRNQAYVNPSAFPELSVVKKANSRAYSYALEYDWAAETNAVPNSSEYGNEIGRLFHGWTDLQSFLTEQSRPSGWMLKGDHGYAGTANRRIPAGPLTSEDEKILRKILSEHGQAVLEPWHDRLLDLSVNFTISPGGGIADFCGHELFNSQDGTFLGVKLSPNRLPPEPWQQPLHATAAKLGLALDRLGYFGPVSMDAYVWRSENGPQLRPLVDINARHSMAMPIHGLGKQLTGKTLLWIWMKPRKISIPDNYAQLDRLLGKWAFNSQTKTGILPISPIWKSDDKELAKRIGFLFSADGEEELSSMRRGFNAVMGKS